MIPLLAALLVCLTTGFCVREFFHYLTAKDHLHHTERRELYARIQTPEYAPMLAPTTEQEDETSGYREEDEVLHLLGRDQ